jgi:hypothetical protein
MLEMGLIACDLGEAYRNHVVLKVTAHGTLTFAPWRKRLYIPLRHR